jgi:hypothetical protein
LIGVLILLTVWLGKIIFDGHSELIKENKEQTGVIKDLQASAGELKADASRAKGAHGMLVECIKHCPVAACSFKDMKGVADDR